MKQINVLWLILVIAIFTNCDNKISHNNIIEVDFEAEFPMMELRLSDLAEVSYIPLQGEDSNRIVTHSYILSKAIYIDSNYIIVGDHFPNHPVKEKMPGIITVFDYNGQFLRNIGFINIFKGRVVNLSFCMDIEPVSNNIFVCHIGYPRTVPFFKYDIQGNLLYKDTINKKHTDIALFGDSLHMYNSSSRYVSYFTGKIVQKGRTLNVMDLNTGEFIDCDDIEYSKPHDMNIATIVANYKAKNGVYLTNDRSDTVYFVDRSLNVTPKFVATRHYDKDMNLVCPIMETDEYILFCNKMNMGARDNNRFEFANYIYVKKQNKIYKITPGCPIADYNAVPFEDYLLKDYLRVHPYFNTLNSNIMVCPLSIEYLKSHYETLPEELKSIAGKAHPDDNPVLMIMRFGKQLPKVSSLVQ